MVIGTIGIHEVDDAKLAYEILVKENHGEYSSFAPWIVLVHGYGLDRRGWEPQLEPFVSSGYRVLTYDLRGFGKSIASTSGYSLDDDIRDLASLMDAVIGPNDTVHLVGVSHGAVVAQYYAGQYQERVASVTFSGGPMTPTSMNPKMLDNLQGLKLEGQRHGIFAAMKYNLENSPAIIQSKNFGNWDQISAIMLSQPEDGRWASLVHQAGFVPPSSNGTQLLIGLQVPVMAIDGEADAVHPHVRERAEWLEVNVPGFRRRCLVPAAGHLCSLDNPKVFTAEILAFIGEVATAAALPKAMN